MAELVIFDCDGVLVDSDRISLRIQAEWVSALGLEMTYSGKTTSVMLIALLADERR